MELNPHAPARRDPTSGASPVLAERVLRLAEALGLPRQWQTLAFGNPSRRSTAFATEHRLAPVLAGSAFGLRGLAPANLWLRPNTALRQHTGGRFPDQGTIHRWLAQATDAQAAALRRHLHEVARAHGRFWQELYSGRLLVVDIDGQGLVARGRRFQRAHGGYLGGGMDTGYPRHGCYAGANGGGRGGLLVAGDIQPLCDH